ncbi:MAG: ABC transporter ATP-binding protein [Nitrospinaceae bacterium]|nr:ABC transporter ATP-binding protein [Nitrospinaceae bacterium]MBT3435982.1 ABC transporter ATP-binding protein [Nitrospinaceae bacterium]MBT3823009.1 ABC transporter ATP-binding protein [Nitrospinaceae bacterium]MBT4094832.1 ABC transporter ATP-binding protein [Nitrospinaceae bacterium]MBT4431886.1 ABC transporter ATP-binding protein [Nitrospinaceae bacterium]
MEIKGVEKSFGDIKVLRGVDLEIREGDITVIIGRSGEGKSVLLKHIIGLLRPDRGEVCIDGENISVLRGAELNRIRSKFGMLFQSAALFDSMTVGENVAFPLKEHTQLSGAEIAERVSEKLHLVGLDGIEGRMPSQLSGGMQKRVGLARAIVREPEILLYDEPTTGLDPILSDSIDRLIVHMEQSIDITSVVISHDIKSALEYAHSVAMLHEGKIIAHGTPQEIMAEEDPIVRQFIAGTAEGPIQVV